MVLGMSYEDEVDELEEIKRRKLAEYQRRLEAERRRLPGRPKKKP
jgi:DNA-binding TFAR19-related protein